MSRNKNRTNPTPVTPTTPTVTPTNPTTTDVSPGEDTQTPVTVVSPGEDTPTTTNDVSTGEDTPLLAVVYDPHVGIIAHLRNQLWSPNGTTKGEMVTLLTKLFPTRDPYGMAVTVGIQLGRLQKKYGKISSTMVLNRGRVYRFDPVGPQVVTTTPVPTPTPTPEGWVVVDTSTDVAAD